VLQNYYLSVDPTQKIWATHDAYMPACPLNEPLRTGGIGKIIASNNDQFPLGRWVFGLVGLQLYSVLNSGFLVPDYLIHGLGGIQNFIPVLAITCFPTAYVGMECVTSDMDKEGKTLVVSGAAGNVGQWVVQLGKLLYGMRVVGIAGGKEKCDHLVKELGCDAAIDYKSQNVGEALKELCPNGVDVYYDNVGGEITESVFENMNNFGRVVFCGSISSYVGEPWALRNYSFVMMKRLRVQGFIVTDYPKLVRDSYAASLELIETGKLKYYTHPVNGLEHFFEAFNLLFSGANKGKVFLRLVE